MLKQCPFVVLFSLCLCIQVQGQIGGSRTYEFLNTVSSARVAALGGNQIAVIDDDLNLGIYNPAALSPGMDKQMAIGYVDYPAGINFGLLSYAKDKEGVGTFALSLLYNSYGKFVKTDEAGNELGSFSAGDYVLALGYGTKWKDVFRLGGNFKTIFSDYAIEKSFGLALDLSAMYQSKNELFTTTVLLKNAGFQIDPYTSGNREPIPIEVQWGSTIRLEHAPLRFGVILENLQNWELAYVDPDPALETDPLTGEEFYPEQPGLAEQALRHLVLNAEVLPSENFHLRFGFNYRQRKEMAIENAPGAVGFSMGVGFKISKYHFSYARSNTSKAGGANYVSISANLSEFRNKK